jgi:membrane-associated protease RseP (regulator of RpoE activity)
VSDEADERPRVLLPAALFATTVLSVFYAGATQRLARRPESYIEAAFTHGGIRAALRTLGWALGQGWRFAVPLLAILVTHELGHYLLARRHRVPASLPMFVPFPNLLGTMGAVISMRPIGSRNALVDIGAAGPLAGLVLAIPITAIGLALSPVEPLMPGGLLEGDALLYLLLKRLVCGPIPTGYDVQLHPFAFAGWTGLFMTMLNLLPVGQLDGGHVMYALFGRRADRWSRWFIAALLGYALALSAYIALTTPRALLTLDRFEPALIWGPWALVTRVVLRLSGDEHPPAGDDPLTVGRKAIALLCLALFALLFMPLPMRAV